MCRVPDLVKELAWLDGLENPTFIKVPFFTHKVIHLHVIQHGFDHIDVIMERPYDQGESVTFGACKECNKVWWSKENTNAPK